MTHITKRIVSLGLALMLLLTASVAFAEDTVTLKALLPLGGVLVDEIGTGPSYEALKEITGYELDISSFTPDQGVTTINMAMASREDYDYIRGASADMLLNYVENGAVAPLTESIEKYGQDLKALFSEDVWKAFTLDDGNIYAIPSVTNPRIWNTMTIRTDWLEAVGMDVPKTLDEFVEVLRAFKEKDPGNVGADNIIPFTTSVFSANAIDYDPFLGAFNITYPWNIRDGKMVHRVELPEFKEYVKFYRDLFAEGLLDADIAVVKDDTLQEKVNRGVVGLARYNYYYAYLTWEMWEQSGLEYQLNFIPCPTGPDGYSGQQVDTAIGTMVFVPATSDKVDDVVKFANAFAKNYEYMLIGAEGSEWNWVDGKRVPVLPWFNEARGDMFFYQPVISGDIEYELWLTRVNKVEKQGKAYADCMAATEGQTMINPLAYAMNLPVCAKYSSSLESMINETVLRVVVGDLPLEALDELAENWRANGGAECTEEVNAWYESQK